MSADNIRAHGRTCKLGCGNLRYGGKRVGNLIEDASEVAYLRACARSCFILLQRGPTEKHIAGVCDLLSLSLQHNKDLQFDKLPLLCSYGLVATEAEIQIAVKAFRHATGEVVSPSGFFVSKLKQLRHRREQEAPSELYRHTMVALHMALAENLSEDPVQQPCLGFWRDVLNQASPSRQNDVLRMLTSPVNTLGETSHFLTTSASPISYSHSHTTGVTPSPSGESDNVGLQLSNSGPLSAVGFGSMSPLQPSSRMLQTSADPVVTRSEQKSFTSGSGAVGSSLDRGGVDAFGSGTNMSPSSSAAPSTASQVFGGDDPLGPRQFSDPFPLSEPADFPVPRQRSDYAHFHWDETDFGLSSERNGHTHSMSTEPETAPVTQSEPQAVQPSIGQNELVALIDAVLVTILPRHFTPLIERMDHMQRQMDQLTTTVESLKRRGGN